MPVKRALDLVLAAPAALFLTPLYALLVLLVKLDSPGPAFFRQDRVGRGGKVFRVWKLRTMVVGAQEQGLRETVARGDPRITRIGRALRHAGLDELPQLLNVLRGDMSLVGPRPTLPYQAAHYDEVQRRRLLLRPGITSLAVVSGRNALSWRERIALDVWYVDHWSLGLDLRILARTLWVVLVTRRGLYGQDGVNDPFVPPPRDGEDDGRPAP